jgi:hypothetical protein
LDLNLEIDYYLSDNELMLFLPEFPDKVPDRIVKLVVRE